MKARRGEQRARQLGSIPEVRMILKNLGAVLIVLLLGASSRSVSGGELAQNLELGLIALDSARGRAVLRTPSGLVTVDQEQHGAISFTSGNGALCRVRLRSIFESSAHISFRCAVEGEDAGNKNVGGETAPVSLLAKAGREARIELVREDELWSEIRLLESLVEETSVSVPPAIELSSEHAAESLLEGTRIRTVDRVLIVGSAPAAEEGPDGP